MTCQDREHFSQEDITVMGSLTVEFKAFKTANFEFRSHYERKFPALVISKYFNNYAKKDPTKNLSTHLIFVS